MESLGGALLLVPCIASWLLFAQATLADQADRAATAPAQVGGFPRVTVARAIAASVYIPGVGHLILGWSRRRAYALALTFGGIVALTISRLIPVWSGIILAALPWATAQVELRRRTGWTRPLFPRWSDLTPSAPDEPAPFAHAAELTPDDPRRGWRGRE
jgi:hypothetical protein